MRLRKLIFSWSLVILWMLVIFCFSQTPGKESNNGSKETIKKVVTVSIDTTNKVGLISKNNTKKNIDQIVTTLNRPLRKCMHASVYLILTILIMNAFKVANLSPRKKIILSMIICAIYACTDELHQLFVNGRTGQFSDVLIDIAGGLLGIIIYYSINHIKTNKKNMIYST